ncbi:ATP-dependent DNA helicase PIF1-like protein [Tanacetum coccineum]
MRTSWDWPEVGRKTFSGGRGLAGGGGRLPEQKWGRRVCLVVDVFAWPFGVALLWAVSFMICYYDVYYGRYHTSDNRVSSRPSLGGCDTNARSSSDIVSRAILSTKNKHVDSIDNELIDRFPSEEKVYYSFDEAEDDTHNFYPLEFLNSLNMTGLPPHCLLLKIRCPIFLLRSLDPANGLCNGMRLIYKRFDPNVINAEIAAEQHTGVRVLFPRIPLAPSEEDMFPFKLKRTQFLVRLSFAMTINKAQGQTIPNAWDINDGEHFVPFSSLG